MANFKENQEVILGKGDGLMDAADLTTCKDAVCFISCADGKRASGFFASAKIKGSEKQVIVTNNHVIGTPEDAKKALAIFRYEGQMPGEEAKLLPDRLFYTNQVLDYTIIGCDDQLIQGSYGIEPLQSDCEVKINEGDNVLIFQHPKGMVKQYSQRKVLKINPPYIYYDADTDEGSSGSPVVHKHKLIALHSAGNKIYEYNRGTLFGEILNHLNHGKYTKPTPIQDWNNEKKRKGDDAHDPLLSPPKKTKLTDIGNIQLSDDTNSCHQINSRLPNVPNMQPTEDMLNELSKDIIDYWKHLGRKLKVPDNKIKEIHRDNINYVDITDKTFAMLMAWKESSSNNTAKELYNALVGCGKVDTASRHFPNCN